MKLIIAGSRTLSFHWTFLGSLMSIQKIGFVKEIVAGGAKGVDTIAEHYALQHGTPFKMFPAEWEEHGKAAGAIRNKQMADYADALLLVWDGESRGSRNMKETMLKQGKPVYEVILKGPANGR